MDLKSAYHQVELSKDDRIYTAFEADGGLCQFIRMPFELKNAVPCFQRVIDDIIRVNKCENTYAYLDNITICGKTQEEHDTNLQRFLRVAKECNLTFNDDKSTYSSKTIDLLGYRISQGTIKPDPERVQPLLEMTVPENAKALRRVTGMFAYYAQWLPNFSDKIRPLVQAKNFPLDSGTVSAFKEFKKSLAEVTLSVIDDNERFTVETDASEFAVSTTLNQNNKPVAFYSRTLSSSEMHHSNVEKEATAVVEAVRRWSHFLPRQPFTLVTDQKSVSFMYDPKKHSKVKNDKILGWRLELSHFRYDIVYRAGKHNSVPDALSRAYCANLATTSLYEIHSAFCHPGVTRLNHYVKTKNLPFSLEEVRKTVADCRVCLEIKLRFVKPQSTPLIKATQPFERLSMDFKSPAFGS